jgi:hypothetical protein
LTTGRLFLLYAPAKAYDEAGDVKRAFLAAEAGAQLRRARWIGDADAELGRLAEAAPGRAAAGGKGDLDKRVVFVFGLPRSGTTLVGQILASHGDVVTLGETERFAQEAKRHANPANLARAYLDALPAAARGAACVVDKSLGSALHIGAIRAAFPNARLVHVRRDPLDVGLSCHFTLFQHDLLFPPDLAAFGRYARAHGALMQAWGRALPGTVWRGQTYEALVTAPERETRDLLAFLGLEMHPECLSFAGARSEVRTASLAQVREAPHRRSVGRWRRYTPYLAPLRGALC